MKQTHKLSRIIPLLTLVLCISISCSKDDLNDIEKKIIGNWNCDRVEYISTGEEGYTLLNSITFNGDGTLKLNNGHGVNYGGGGYTKGKWSYLGNSRFNFYIHNIFDERVGDEVSFELKDDYHFECLFYFDSSQRMYFTKN